jgi:hypothetical protein
MRNRWLGSAGLGLGLAFGVFALYFVTYPIRHLALPAGFDPPYYVLRGQHLAAEGIGHGVVASRPGFPILSTLLGAVTGRSQIDMTIFLSMVLVAVLALAVGAFVASGIDRTRIGWVLAVGSAGVVLGATQLVGENLANILNISLEIAALVPLLNAVAGDQPGRGLAAAVALIVASGMSHWLFLPLFLAVLGLSCLFSLRGSLVEWHRGVPLWRTESGLLAAAGLASTSITAVIIAAVLRAPFRTIEIVQNTELFRKKIRTDAVRLMVPGTLALVGIGWIPSIRRRLDAAGRPDRRLTFSLRILVAWTWVMGVGLVLGILTWFLPPTRFLAHLVALPGAVAVSVVLALGARWLRRQRAWRERATTGATVTATVVVIALALLSLPGLIRWYRYPVLMNPETLTEARNAGRYVAALPAGQPVVFLTDYRVGNPGAYATVMNDRTIRIGMPPARDLDVFVVPGTLEDLLAGRRTPPPNSSADRIALPFWEEARAVLPTRPPILVLEGTGPAQFADALAHGAETLAPGVALVRGPAVPTAPATAGRSTSSLPDSFGAGLGFGLLILVLLGAVGAGWTRLALGPNAPPEVAVSLAPSIGAGALILGGLVASVAGVRPAGMGGVITVAVIGAVGYAAGWARAVVPRR